ELPRPRGDRPATKVVAPFAEFVRETETHVGKDTVCVGSAAAVSDIVRRENGDIHLCDTGMLDLPLAECVGEALVDARGTAAPMVVRNGADLAALAEHYRGVAVDCDNVIYLYGDGGVSSGIIAGGRQVTGHGGHGGQVGHMVVNPAGRVCGC